MPAYSIARTVGHSVGHCPAHTVARTSDRPRDGLSGSWGRLGQARRLAFGACQDSRFLKSV